MSRAIIITSYLEHPLDLKDLLQPDDYIVCLDGGYDIARRHNVHPNLVLGDFDSIRTQKQVMPAEHPGLQVLRYPPEKDYTDRMFDTTKRAKPVMALFF